MNGMELQVVDQPDGSVVLTVLARNPVIATLAALIAGLPAFGCLILALIGIAEGQLGTAIMFLAIGAGCVWLAWRFGWQVKRYQIIFDTEGIRSGSNSLAYPEISEIVVDFNGGAAFDPGSMRIPRNTTPGHHVSVKARGQLIPITTGLKLHQAREVRDACVAAFDRFATGPSA